MLATTVAHAFAQPGWIYEEKYDGIRLIAYKDGLRVRLLTRNLIDRTDRFPAIAAAVAALPAATLVLDGEAVVFDARAVSRFGLLQRPEGREAVFVVFDCLHANGRDLGERPLVERRTALEREMRESPVLRLARRLGSDGQRALARARRLGLEGIIAKDPGVALPGWPARARLEEDQAPKRGGVRDRGVHAARGLALALRRPARRGLRGPAAALRRARRHGLHRCDPG